MKFLPKQKKDFRRHIHLYLADTVIFKHLNCEKLKLQAEKQRRWKQMKSTKEPISKKLESMKQLHSIDVH